MLWSSSSSIHRGGTPAPWAAAMRCCSSGTSPAATAAANRTSAAVAGSSGPAPPLRDTPWPILLLPPAGSPILLLLQPPIYAQLTDPLAARVHHRPGAERHRSPPQPQLLQHGRHRQRRRDGMPVADLDGHPQSLPRQQRAVDALGPDLDDHPAGMRAHQLGTGAALSGDEIGVTHHRLHDCGLRIAACTPPLRIRKPPSEI